MPARAYHLYSSPNEMPKVSAVVITFNEEKRLRDALDSLRFCDELLVLDAGSTDRTRDIAAEAGARVEVNAPWPGFVEQRSRAVAAARHDWVLAVDADERVTPALREEIQAAAARSFDGNAGYRLPRVTHYLGRWVRGTDWYPDPQLRLFDRRRGGWQGGLIHESVVVQGPVGRLTGEIEHFSYDDVSDHLATIDRYTTLWARQAQEEGRRAGVLEPLASAAWAFVRNYVVRGGFKEGEAGLAVSVLNAHYTFVKLLKLRERARQDARRR